MLRPPDDSLNRHLASILERLQASQSGLLAVGLADANGLPVAFFGPRAEKEAATAMASLVLGAAQRAAIALGVPAVRDVLIDVDGFTILVRPIGERFTLLATLSAASDVGLARMQVQSFADDILVALEDA